MDFYDIKYKIKDNWSLIKGCVITFLWIYLGMFIANFCVWLFSFGIDIVGYIKGTVAGAIPFWDFVFTCIDSGIFYWFVALLAFKKGYNYCYDTKEKIILLIVITCLTIVLYDDYHFQDLQFLFPYNDSMGCYLWNTLNLDILNGDKFGLDYGISTMRYTVFDLAIITAGIIQIFNDD